MVRLAAQLAGYRGVRLLQDNVLWKPPGTKAIGFHQDASYADYLVPPEMVTCWISLDDLPADAGPVEYVRGSHRWPRTPPQRSQFHAPEDWLAPARAAAPEGEEPDLVPVVGEGRRRLVPPRPHVARLAAEHERGGRADGARRAPAPGRGALPRRSTSTRSTRATAAAATCRSTSRSSPSCGTRPATARPWLAELPAV